MNTMLFKSAYDKVRLSEEFKAVAKQRLMQFVESHDIDLANTDAGQARAYTVIEKKNSAWKMVLGFGTLAAAVAVAVLVGVRSGDNAPIDTSLSPLSSGSELSQSVQADEDTRQAIKNGITVALTKLDTLRSGMKYDSNAEQILDIAVVNSTWSCSAADPDNFTESDSMTWGSAGTANASTQKEDIKNGESFICYELCSLMPDLKSTSMQVTLCGGRCTSVVFTENEGLVHNDDTDTEIQTPQLGSIQIGDEIAKKFADEWSVIAAESMMVLPEASVFFVRSTKDFDNVIGIVYPEYKTNRTVFYGVKNAEIIDIGSIPSGWQFEVMDNGEDELLHVVYVLSGSGGMSEIEDNYYKISSDGVTLVNSYGRMESNGSANEWFRYEDGSVKELTLDEYNNAMAEIVEEYSVTQCIDLDKDADFSNDNYFDFLDDTDGFSEYIADMLEAQTHIELAPRIEISDKEQ